MDNVLIIGGSGMLSGVCNYFLKAESRVTVLSRTNKKEAFERGDVHWLKGDYDNEDFMDIVEDYFNSNDVSTIIIWMHNEHSDNFKRLMTFLMGEPKTDVFHVRGSSAFYSLDTVKYGDNYHQVILGMNKSNGEIRWLKNSEISLGVIVATQEKKKVFTVGIAPED